MTETSRPTREVESRFSGMSQKSTYTRQALQAHNDQERLTSRNNQPSSEKRAAYDNHAATGPGRAGTPA